jgi:hypothetical protein
MVTMTQSFPTIEPAHDGTFGWPESMILPRADISAQHDEDDVLDSCLASLGTREFELFLIRLADDNTDARSAQEWTA